MISSSKRVIKRPDGSGSVSVEAYLPPTEQLISSHAVPRAPVFPRYTPEGVREDDLQLALKETASSMPSDEEDMEGLRKKETTITGAKVREAGRRKRSGSWRMPEERHSRSWRMPQGRRTRKGKGPLRKAARKDMPEGMTKAIRRRKRHFGARSKSIFKNLRMT